MRLIHTAALLALLAASACTRSDGLYCDDNTPCTRADRPFCDLLGEFPASAGIGRTCIADPSEIPQADGGLDPEPDATVTCTLSSECSVSMPICVDQNCSECQFGAVGDSACLDRNAGLPKCGNDGTCRECNRSADCGNPLAPICNTDTGTCEACVDHGECGSGACDFDSGSCVSVDDIIYADISAGTDGLGCGDQTGSAACQHIGGALGALAKVTGDRKIIVLAVGNYIEAVSISATDVHIVGHDSRLFPMSFLVSPALSIVNGSSVRIDDLNVEGGNSIAAGSGLDCDSSDVFLRAVSLRNNDDAGLRASDCAIEIEDSHIHNNGHQGLRINEGTALAMTTSLVEANGFQGLLASDSIVELTRTRILSNQAGGVRLIDSSFLLENDIIAKNGNNGANPANPAGGIVITNAASKSPQLIRHSTIVDNQAPSSLESAGLICDTNNAVSAVSSIIVDNLRPGSDPQFAGDTCSISFSSVQGISSGDGNIAVAPTFVSAVTGDYHLAAGSAGIDLGSPSSPTSVDFEGDPRPSGAGYEMGADERP